jgi:hypothetical protein
MVVISADNRCNKYYNEVKDAIYEIDESQTFIIVYKLKIRRQLLKIILNE